MCYFYLLVLCKLTPGCLLVCLLVCLLLLSMLTKFPARVWSGHIQMQANGNKLQRHFEADHGQTDPQAVNMAEKSECMYVCVWSSGICQESSWHNQHPTSDRCVCLMLTHTHTLIKTLAQCLLGLICSWKSAVAARGSQGCMCVCGDQWCVQIYIHTCVFVLVSAVLWVTFVSSFDNVYNNKIHHFHFYDRFDRDKLPPKKDFLKETHHFTWLISIWMFVN